MRSIAVIGIASVAMVSIGTCVGLLDYLSTRPSVSVHVDDVHAVLPKVNFEKVFGSLEKMEEARGSSLDPWSAGLIAHLKNERSFDDLVRGLDELRFTFERRQDQLPKLIGDLESLRDDIGQIGNSALVEKLKQLENKYVDISGNYLNHLIHRMKDSPPETDSQQVIYDLRRAILTFKAGYGDRIYENVISDLNDIVGGLKDAEKDRRLQVVVTIENRSQIDNALKKKAIMSVGSGTSRTLYYLDLVEKEEGGAQEMPHSSVVRRVFELQSASGSDVEIFADNPENDNVQCQVAIMDIHEKVWASAKGHCKNNDKNQLEKMEGYFDSWWRLLD